MLTEIKHEFWGVYQKRRAGSKNDKLEAPHNATSRRSSTVGSVKFEEGQEHVC